MVLIVQSMPRKLFIFPLLDPQFPIPKTRKITKSQKSQNHKEKGTEPIQNEYLFFFCIFFFFKYFKKRQ
jgi:hypothetical protein